MLSLLSLLPAPCSLLPALQDPKITVRVDTDYFQVKDQLPEHDLIIFTGPIDAYFASQGLPKVQDIF